MTREIKCWGNYEYLKVSKKEYDKFMKTFIGMIENDFYMDWLDSYDWSLRSGKHKIGSWDNALECRVARHYCGWYPKDHEYYIRLDYAKAKGYEL
jgi:hypothetical protein